MFILPIGEAYAQPEVEWEKTFGAEDNEEAWSVQQTIDGGYIIAGSTYSIGGIDSDVYLVKTDSEGILEWEKTFGGPNLDYGRSVQQTTDGGYIMAGWTRSIGAIDSDVYLIKTDSDGSMLWEKTFGGPNLDCGGNSVQQTIDEGYIIAGWISYPLPLADTDVYLIKTDSDGNELWSRDFTCFPATDIGYSVQQTTDGGYIIAGYTRCLGAGGADVYLIKTDSEGDEQWDFPWWKTFGGAKDDFGRSVQQTTDPPPSSGGYIIAGWTTSFDAGGDDVYLVKTDSDGNELWYETFGGYNSDYGYSVQQTIDGGYIIAGETKSFGESMDVYLIKTDSDGNELWYETFGGSNYDCGRSVQQTKDGGYIIAGWTRSFGAGESDVYLIKVKGLFIHGELVRWWETLELDPLHAVEDISGELKVEFPFPLFDAQQEEILSFIEQNVEELVILELDQIDTDSEVWNQISQSNLQIYDSIKNELDTLQYTEANYSEAMIKAEKLKLEFTTRTTQNTAKILADEIYAKVENEFINILKDKFGLKKPSIIDGLTELVKSVWPLIILFAGILAGLIIWYKRS
jgi:hypothetical protein